MGSSSWMDEHSSAWPMWSLMMKQTMGLMGRHDLLPTPISKEEEKEGQEEDNSAWEEVVAWAAAGGRQETLDWLQAQGKIQSSHWNRILEQAIAYDQPHTLFWLWHHTPPSFLASPPLSTWPSPSQQCYYVLERLTGMTTPSSETTTL